MITNTLQHQTLSSSKDSDEVNLLDEYVQEILLSKIPFVQKRQVVQKFENVDSLKFFYIVKELEKELGFIKLENIILYQFLEKNDPKYLIGLNKTLEEKTKSDKTTQKIQFSDKRGAAVSKESMYTKRIQGTASTHSLAKTTIVTGSMASIGSTFSATTRQTDARLNYNMKSEICEKYFMDLKKNFEKVKSSAISQIKSLRAKIDELNYCNNEILGTINSFQDVVVNLGYDPKTGKIPAEKFFKYFLVWNKNAMGLISNLRLKIQTLHEQCYQLKMLIVKKADLAGMLGPADFEQMLIKKEKYTKELEDRNYQLIKIKHVAGKASSAVNAQRNILLTLEFQLKHVNTKIYDCTLNTLKMEKEHKEVVSEINKVKKNIELIEEKIIKYEAPSVAQYIEQNDKLIQLERREKLLHRQVGILALKLNNVKIKIMQQKQKKK